MTSMKIFWFLNGLVMIRGPGITDVLLKGTRFLKLNVTKRVYKKGVYKGI